MGPDRYSYLKGPEIWRRTHHRRPRDGKTEMRGMLLQGKGLSKMTSRAAAVTTVGSSRFSPDPYGHPEVRFIPPNHETRNF